MNWFAFASALLSLVRGITTLLQHAANAARAKRLAELRSRAAAHDKLATAVLARQRAREAAINYGKTGAGGNPGANPVPDPVDGVGGLRGDRYRRD